MMIFASTVSSSGTFRRSARFGGGYQLTAAADCQKAHWNTHKGLCPGSRSKLNFPGETFNVHLPEETPKAYGKIIDTFRMRIEDDYSHGQHNHGLYAQGNPMRTFVDFLDRGEAIDAFMPRWWDAGRRAQCVDIATKQDGDHFIGHAVEKADIQDFWKDNMMPMQLRMLAENVYGGGYGMGQGPMPKGYQCACSW
jgi:splicing suppressor protein 51